MERFDILNQSGERTGMTADKGAPLQDGQYYLGVHGYIYNTKNEFLLQQRALDKEFLPGGWEIHMGHVVTGETSAEGMIREVHEELGLDIALGDLQLIGRVFWEEYHHLVDVYFIKVDFRVADLRVQENEVIGVKTLPLSDMLSLVSGMHYRPASYRDLVTAALGQLG